MDIGLRGTHEAARFYRFRWRHVRRSLLPSKPYSPRRLILTTSGLRSERGRGKTILMPSSGVRREKHAHTFPRVLSKLFRTRDRAVAEQHRAVERRRHNQPIKLGCREQRIVNRKSATVREPFECRRKRCNRPPGASGIERAPRFWKRSSLPVNSPRNFQDLGGRNNSELPTALPDQEAPSSSFSADST